jgi:putative ABC transport system ATP-binding protein
MPTSQETRVQAGTTDRGTVLCAPANCERNRPVVTIRGRQGSIGIAMIRQPSPAVVDAVFHMHEITKIYRMGDVTVEALRGITLDLLPGEFVVMLGPSGSGKSTLLNILGGLDVPTSGEVHYRDHNLTAATREELTRFRREHVGFVFQFYNLIPSLTALENTALVSEISENPLDPEECLRMVGLGDRLHHFPAQMSGGEQQRVAIARAVVKRPEVLLCDEPTGALDYATGKIVLEVLDQVNRELKTITVVITHNAAIASMADRVIRISSGMIAEIQKNERRVSPAELAW